MSAVLKTLCLTAALLVLAQLCGCTPLTAVRQHPDFDEVRSHIERVAVLPPTVKVERVMFSGDNETLEDKEASFPANLTASASSILNDHGFATSKVDLAALALQDTELAFQVEQVKNAYEAAARELYDDTVTADDYKRFRVTLGPVVNPIADIAGADALLLVKFEGITKSDGQVRKEITANILLGALTGTYYQPVKSASAVEVALIDGATGAILWVNTAAAEGLSTSVLGSALAKIPDGAMQEQIAAEQAADQAEAAAQAEAAKAAGIVPASQPASWQK